MPSKLIKRMLQIKQIFWSKQLASPFLAMEASQRKYQDPEEVRFYTEIAGEGLWPQERRAVDWAIQKLKAKKKALVVGCGAGREAFALEDLFDQVTAIDSSASMIDAAQRIGSERRSQVSFLAAELSENFSCDEFDFILISEGLSNHIASFDQRVAFFKLAQMFLQKKDDIIIYSPDIFSPPPGSIYYWSEKLIAMRWKTSSTWEPGDNLRARYGPYQTDYQLGYFHFYPSETQFLAEIDASKLRVLKQFDDIYAFGPAPE